MTEAEMAAIKAQVEADAPGEYHGALTTTAPEGASIEDVKAGIKPAGEVHDGASPAGYAEGGSLARAIEEEAWHRRYPHEVRGYTILFSLLVAEYPFCCSRTQRP